MKKEYKFTGDFVQVALETDLSGKVREKVYLKDSVNILLRDGDHFLLLREKRWEKDGEMSGLKLLSGLVEENEEIEISVKREIMEEVNLEIKSITLVFDYSQTGTVNQKKYYYIVDVAFDSKLSRENIVPLTLSEVEKSLSNGDFGITTSGSLSAILRVIKKKTL